MSSEVLFILFWIVVLGLFAYFGYQRVRKGTFSSTNVLAFGLPLFALLCLMCFRMHGAELLGAGSSEAVAPASALAAPTLEAKLFDGNVTLNGTLPDQAAKDKVLAQAKELYGAGKFTDNLKIGARTGFPNTNWFPAALGLMQFGNKANNEGGIAVEGDSVTVRGMVDNEEAKTKLIAAATNAARANIKVIDKVIIKGKVTEAQAADFQTKLNQMIAGKIVEFDTGKDVITPKGKEVLDQMVVVLGQVPGVPVEVGGYTDSRGNATANLDLSRRRAAACRQYLSSHGVATERLTAKGYGSASPIADNATINGQQRNRRIEFTVTKEAK